MIKDRIWRATKIHTIIELASFIPLERSDVSSVLSAGSAEGDREEVAVDIAVSSPSMYIHIRMDGSTRVQSDKVIRGVRETPRLGCCEQLSRHQDCSNHIRLVWTACSGIKASAVQAMQNIWCKVRGNAKPACFLNLVN